ncbi:NAD(P)/FAD-dependent oxidoreductase [Ottowia thiooxydans]|uniref:Thioredoxin reductase (NADPH) n=1 Tax=Ottowia thiooxydans TaxID=219182 RepID=A0ABV2QG15_9BURK
MEIDVVIVGAGPSGLRASARLAQNGVAVIVLYQGLIGGELKSVPWIEDSEIAPNGMTGLELSEKLADAATQAGVKFHVVEVHGVEAYADCATVLLADEAFLTARAVILATGTKPVQMDSVNLSAYEGAGHIACVSCDAIFYENSPVLVSGGGYGGAGDALHLARYASKVFVVEKSSQLNCGATRMQAIVAHPKIEVLLNTQVTSAGGFNGLDSVVVQGDDGLERALQATGISIQIGRQANNNHVRGALDLDPDGFIKTDGNGITSAPNLFAIGDARSGSNRTILDALVDADKCAALVASALDKELSA